MLDLKQLQQLNDYMLGKGAPIEKDGTGYNKPDFSKMEIIGYLNDLSDTEGYLIASTLNKYKNTQLSQYASQIDETLDHYKNTLHELDSMFDYEKSNLSSYESIVERHGKNNFHKLELNVTELTYAGAFVKFGEFVDDDTLKTFIYSENKASWAKGSLYIPWENMNEFMKIMPMLGKFGYQSAKIEEIMTDFENKRPPISDEEIKLQQAYNDKNKHYIHSSVRTLNINDSNVKIAIEPAGDYIKNKLWSYKTDGMNIEKIQKNNDSISFYIDLDELPEIKNKLGVEITLDNYWREREKQYGYIIDYSDIEKNKEKIIETANDYNKSPYTLLDVSKLPLPFAPYPFQLEDAGKAVESKRMLLGHDMGCGKTFISALIGGSIPERKLVIVPESLRLNWKRELENVYPDADVKILYSKDDFNTAKDWTIVGYKTLEKYSQELLNEKFKCIFADEAHYCKAVNNFGKPTSKRGIAVMELADKAENVYLLTGTPMPTRNKDLYNILKMLKNPEVEDKKFFDFGIKYCAGFNNGFGWNFNGSSKAEELHEVLNKNMIRRLKSEVLPDLKKQRQFIPLEINSAKYKSIEKQLGDADSEGTFLGLCQTGRKYLSEAKVKDCIDFADTILSTGESVVIVSEFRDTIDSVVKKYGEDKCCKIEGGMKDSDKQKSIDDFQSGKKPVIAVNTIAGGVGITLTKSHNMIICDIPYTPSALSQVEDRINRSGQAAECCNIYYLYSPDALMDKLFVDMISDKSENIDKIVDRSENTMNLRGDEQKSKVNAIEMLKQVSGFKDKQKHDFINNAKEARNKAKEKAISKTTKTKTEELSK